MLEKVSNNLQVDELKERLRSLLENRRDLVVYIHGVPEITRPLALELLSQARGFVLGLGGRWEESVQALHVSPEYVVLAVKLRVEINGSVLEVVEVGECSKEEKAKDTMARTAYTRALKRALESLVGEDFINKLVLSLVEPATENQRNFLRALISRGSITEELVQSLKGQRVVRAEFSLEDEGSWDKKSVSALIDAIRRRR